MVVVLRSRNIFLSAWVYPFGIEGLLWVESCPWALASKRKFNLGSDFG